MAVFIVFIVLVVMLILLLANSVRDAVRCEIYQRKWDAEKANRRRIDPDVSNAELCELYVDFCCEYDCNVEF
jgi:hypothetical protein